MRPRFKKEKSKKELSDCREVGGLGRCRVDGVSTRVLKSRSRRSHARVPRIPPGGSPLAVGWSPLGSVHKTTTEKLQEMEVIGRTEDGAESSGKKRLLRVGAIVSTALVATVLFTGGAVAQEGASDGPSLPDQAADAVPEFVTNVLTSINDFLSGVIESLGDAVSGATPDGASGGAGGGE